MFVLSSAVAFVLAAQAYIFAVVNYDNNVPENELVSATTCVLLPVFAGDNNIPYAASAAHTDSSLNKIYYPNMDQLMNALQDPGRQKRNLGPKDVPGALEYPKIKAFGSRYYKQLKQHKFTEPKLNNLQNTKLYAITLITNFILKYRRMSDKVTLHAKFQKYGSVKNSQIYIIKNDFITFCFD